MFRFASVDSWPQPWSAISQSNIYQQLFKARCKAYPDEKKETCQKERDWKKNVNVSIKSSSDN